MAMVGGMGQAVGKKCPSRTELAQVGGDVQLAGWRVSGRRAAVRQRGGHQCHNLVAGVGSAWGAAQVQVPVNQLGQAQMAG